MKGKRSSTDRIKHQSRHQAGVGARHRQPGRSTGGVGYLTVCNALKSSIQKNRAMDPRISQLKKMGLDWKWIRIAESMGFDSFLQMWTMMSELFDNDRSCIRASIPHVKKLIRFQRNMVINELHSQGHDIQYIHDEIQTIYGISMQLNTIKAVLNTSK